VVSRAASRNRPSWRTCSRLGQRAAPCSPTVEIEACGANQAHLVSAPGLVETHPLIDIPKRADRSKIDLDALPRISLNRYALRWKKDMDGEFSGTTLGVFPRGLSHVPLTWQYLGASISMTLSGGFVGISQDPQTGAVRPAIGWAVREAGGIEVTARSR